MSTKVDSQSQIEEKINSEATKVRERKQETPIDKLLRVLSSVRFGIIILVVLAIFSAIGTFVVQEGTSDFPKFYDSLTPAERSIYKTLGFMDIYHTWYFNLLLLILSLNIILASIDRIPGYWRFFTSPQYTISENGIRYQPWSTALKFPASAFNREFVDKIYAHCRRVMMPRWMQILGPIGDIFAKITLFRIRVTESKDGMLTIFTERGVWNRYAFCVVHVALLMILIGWFVGNKWGQKGVIQFQPGQISENFFALGVDDSVKKFPLPFTIECVDIKQDLIDSSKKDLSPQNTLDWHTTVVFKEKEQLFKGNVHLNEPVDFKGYRFFQASFDQMNSARSVTLLLQSKDGSGQAQEIVLKRNATVEVPGFGTVQWKDFYPDFGMNPQTKQPFSRSGDYNNPAGEFRVLLSDGTPKTALAFSPNFLEAMKNAPFLQEAVTVGNFQLVLKSFEKVSRSHTLQVQYDPGVDTVYLGCALLVMALLTVFFFSHERVWVLIKPGEKELKLCFGGNTTRNRPGFDVHFSQIVSEFKTKDAVEILSRKDGKDGKDEDRQE